jgi:16S rRNA (cytidine1402-2'-O)-methyltransferase
MGRTMAETPLPEDGRAARAGMRQKLAAGLYLVATPIGAARDITLRALDILASADVLAAEDTRTLRHLMEIHGIPLGGRPILAYHDHNGAEARPRLMRHLAEGRSVAYASEAGTPLVADPGYQLVRAAVADGHAVIGAPGASAVLAALTVAGLPTDRFLFAGFPPPAAGARATWIAELATVRATVVLYEAPRRTARTLAELAAACGADRPAALCRELTKRFEEVRRGTLAELAESAAQDEPRGECVIVLGAAPETRADTATVETALAEALSRLSVKDAAAEVADRFGLPRRDVYQMALGKN